MPAPVSPDPVNRRFNMSADEFKGLSKNDQGRVINAKLCDMIIKPLIDKAVKNIRNHGKKDENA